jgi:hypothetical protein
MKFALPQKWIDHLLHLPESGMGYQRVDVHFADGSTQRDCVVLNAETIELPESCRMKMIKDIRLHQKDHPTTP